MGCFNLFCAVSNSVIRYGDRVVVFGLDTEKAKLSLWPRGSKITSLAIRGTYDDYGGIETDPGQEDRLKIFFGMTPRLDGGNHRNYAHIETNTYEFMMIHESVFDYLLTDPFHETWADKWRQEVLKRWEKMYAEHLELKNQSTLDVSRKAINEFRLYDAWREAWMLSGESTGHHHPGWRDFFPSPLVGELYYTEVGAVIKHTHSFGYRLAPSMYAGQTVEPTTRDGLDAVVGQIRANWIERNREDDDWEEDHPELADLNRVL